MHNFFKNYLKRMIIGATILSLFCVGTSVQVRAADTAADPNAAAQTASPVTAEDGKPIGTRKDDGTLYTVDPSKLDDTLVTQTEEQRAAEQAYVYAEPIQSNEVKDWPQGPQVQAQAAIVMDMKSGAVLYGKNTEEKHYPASITKLLTALVALENAAPADMVTFSDDSISFLEPGDASIGMRTGEQLTLENALYGVLLASANEVSYAVAESVGTDKLGGDYNTFIERMNTRAQEIGCDNSHWMNANGLHDGEHYTTAHDMARIGAAVYQLEEFRKITQTLSYEIPATNLVAETRWVQQNHKMLWPANQYYYDKCTGGKTGFTDQAHTTLVTMGENENLQLVVVSLRGYGGQSYTDTAALMDYGFQNFTKLSLKENETSDKIRAFIDETSYVVVPNGASFADLESEIVLKEDSSNKEAVVTYTYNGQNVGAADVLVSSDYYQTLSGDTGVVVEEAASEEPQKVVGGVALNLWKSIPRLAQIAVIAVAVVLVFGIIFLLVVRHRKKQKRRQRRERMRRRRQKQEQ